MAKTERTRKTRVVAVPPPQLPSSGLLPANRVLSVVLQAGEDVEWTWTSLPNGGSYVSGYAIVSRSPETLARSTERSSRGRARAPRVRSS